MAGGRPLGQIIFRLCAHRTIYQQKLSESKGAYVAFIRFEYGYLLDNLLYFKKTKGKTMLIKFSLLLFSMLMVFLITPSFAIEQRVNIDNSSVHIKNGNQELHIDLGKDGVQTHLDEDTSTPSSSGSGFSNAEISGQSFVGKDLSGVSFTNATLTDISFRNANLQNADFANAELINCDLRGANVVEQILPMQHLKALLLKGLIFLNLI